MRRIAFVFSLLVIAVVAMYPAIAAGTGPTVSGPPSSQLSGPSGTDLDGKQIICDPQDHCYSKRKEHVLIDNGKWSENDGPISTDQSLSAGCWGITPTVSFREAWPWGSRDAVTLSLHAHWCWGTDGKITINTDPSTREYTYSFFQQDNLQRESLSCNADHTRCYVRWGTQWSECVTNLVPVCIHLHMYVSVTMWAGQGNWNVTRGVNV